ncbi:hypothetical protein GCM10027451_34770 [Geodermatophilus aquaeductus]|uniref:Excreted virulence factor EspC, type VII ESX diderm n=1 Tax=Geodermatophilus aquaeductus TaxID=1564161 RepID=A0A521CXJ2_9ACTN|nr:hypothetical protein [Geodermatophilus aquaeductus]SMO64167.1 hypothetical protein SAMN06273567_102746 [Geodermatophilus aquaeductus]
MSAPIAIQLDAVQALGEELAALAAELSDDADLCGSTAVSLATAAPGEVSDQAGATGQLWAVLVADLVAGARAASTALLEAVRSYRLADAAVSDRVLAARAALPVGTR